MFADLGTDVVRAAMTGGFALGAARAVNGLALAGVSPPAAGPARPGLLDGIQPEGWGGPLEVDCALPCSRVGTACVSCSIISVDDSPHLGWEDLWTE